MRTGSSCLWSLGSSFRECSPEQTLAKGLPLMQRLGVSRLTEVTRMDRLGLPVFASVRPRSLTIRVTAGKGLRDVEARAGALMEAVEHVVAEPQRSYWKPEPMALTDVVRGFAGRFDLIDLAPRHGIRAAGSPTVTTVACEELIGGGCLHLPAALIFVPFEGDVAAQLYGWSATGLASGNSLEEATLHGLFEVLERDAVAMNWAKDESLWVPHAELPQPFLDLAETWRGLGIDLAVRSVPNVLGLPCFEAYLHDAQGSRVDLANGSGLHVDRGIALARAVCEAAQSRLSYIHGARDDIAPFYDAYATLHPDRRSAMTAAVTKRAFDPVRSTRLADVPQPDAVGASVGEVLQTLISRLTMAGFGTVLRHRFVVELDGLHVVKLVVPRCEDVELGTGRMGRRLLDRVVSRG